MDDNKTLILNVVNSIIENNYEDVEWQGVVVRVNYTISLPEASAIIDKVCDVCFQDGIYNPLIKEFGKKLSIIGLYTNIDIAGLSLDQQYDLVCRSGLFDVIINYINIDQLNSIISSIDDIINIRINNSTSDIMKKANELLVQIESIGNVLSEAFDGLSPDFIKNVGEAMSGGLDEGALVDAILNK